MALTNKTPEREVNELFSRVAPNYDKMNNVVSLGVQKKWRRVFLSHLPLTKNSLCLDLCCGTGDSTIDLARKGRYVFGLDFNQDMLKIATKKITKANLNQQIRLIKGDAMKLPFKDASFDFVTICFGLRNVPDAEKTIFEARRVLKPGGIFAILEMSQPVNPVIKLGWAAYFKVFPYFAKLTKSSVEDYQYLARTSKEFLTAEQLKKLLEKNGFSQVAVSKLTFGAGAIHLAKKSG